MVFGFVTFTATATRLSSTPPDPNSTNGTEAATCHWAGPPARESSGPARCTTDRGQTCEMT
jgi:hypothetical protein